MTVAVNVRGQLDQPFITITSTPAMSSNEALSYLLTGRSVDRLQSGDVQALDSATQSLAVSGGGLLLGGIGSRLGLDEVSVESSGTDDTAVVLGKYLNPKLFVSYGISIAEAINTIKLRYTLTEKWVAQGRGRPGPERRRRVPHRALRIVRERGGQSKSAGNGWFRQCSCSRTTCAGVLRPSDIGGRRSTSKNSAASVS